MRVAIFAQNSSTEYSGGRYHSWMMAEALALAGHEVYYISDNKPVFYDDFSELPNHKDIRLKITNRFWLKLPGEKFDIVVLVPGMSFISYYYYRVLHFSKRRHAKLILLNFETPNWFNLLSPYKRDYRLWNNWKIISKYATLILSSTKESNKYAKLFFNNCPVETIFDYCYPSINNFVSDSVVGIKKEKQILLLTRFSNSEHKGGLNISKLICNAMRGYTLVLIVGSGEVPDELMTDMLRKAIKHGVSIEVKYKLTDYEKFVEIKKSSLILFTSFFEGFGYPPIEAQYCNIPCIAFDLPVLREVSGDGIIYVKTGDFKTFREKIKEVLNSKGNYEYLRDNIENVALIQNYSKNLDRICSKIFNQKYLTEFANKEFSFLFMYEFLRMSVWFVISIYKRLFNFLFYKVLRSFFRPIIILIFPDIPGDNLIKEVTNYVFKVKKTTK